MRERLNDLAFMVPGVFGRDAIPWYHGLKRLTDSLLDRCAPGPAPTRLKIGGLLLAIVLICVCAVFAGVYLRGAVRAIVLTCCGLLLLAPAKVLYDSTNRITPQFLSNLKRYRDDSLGQLDELVGEFERQGSLSKDEAIDKMNVSLFVEEGTDQPQNYFTWKKVGSKRFVKMYLAATEE